MRRDRPTKSENFKAIAKAFTTKCVSLANSDHLHFHRGGGGGMAGWGQVVQSKEYCFVYTFLVFFLCFHQKIYVFIICIFYDEVSNFCNSMLIN